MIENMSLTSYLDKSYLVASRGAYVASIQMMSRDKLKHPLSQQFLSHDMISRRVKVTLHHDCKLIDTAMKTFLI